MAKRASGAAMGGKWEFPGGKLRPEEAAEEALTREIREELGCEIAVVRELPSVAHRYPDFEIRLLPYLCNLVSGVPEALEHEEITWASREELSFFDWAEADIPIASAYAGGET